MTLWVGDSPLRPSAWRGPQLASHPDSELSPHGVRSDNRAKAADVYRLLTECSAGMSSITTESVQLAGTVTNPFRR